jgi:hypothetical protein
MVITQRVHLFSENQRDTLCGKGMHSNELVYRRNVAFFRDAKEDAYCVRCVNVLHMTELEEAL